MGCKGSKVSKAEEKATATTLLEEGSADCKGVSLKEHKEEAPVAQDSNTETVTKEPIADEAAAETAEATESEAAPDANAANAEETVIVELQAATMTKAGEDARAMADRRPCPSCKREIAYNYRDNSYQLTGAPRRPHDHWNQDSYTDEGCCLCANVALPCDECLAAKKLKEEDSDMQDSSMKPDIENDIKPTPETMEETPVAETAVEACNDEKIAAPEESPIAAGAEVAVTTASAIAVKQSGCLHYCFATEAESEVVVQNYVGDVRTRT